MAAAREYMKLAYDPKRASADAVRHLVAEGASFEAHSTFPAAHDPLTYAQHHADDIMAAVPDLHIGSEAAPQCRDTTRKLTPPNLSSPIAHS